jgi:hypothetical protein
MFPVMVIGVGLSGIALTTATGGRKGLKELRAQHAPTGDPRWLAAQVWAALHGLVLLRLNAPGFPGPAHSSRWPTRPWPASPVSTPRRTSIPPDRHPKENCHASHPRFP